MNSNFYAMLARMKYINRWGLMRNTRNETLSEHCLDTAFIAHALIIIHNRKFGGKLNPEHAACLAMFHDASEIITGDMPTPIKYFNPEIRKAYKDAEKAACDRLVGFLPDYMKADISPLIMQEDEEYMPFIKAADKLSALSKCIEEKGMGNKEFADAEKSTEAAVKALNLPAADEFLKVFMKSYGMTLDRQSDDK